MCAFGLFGCRLKPGGCEAPKGGARRVGPRRVGPEGWASPNCRGIKPCTSCSRTKDYVKLRINGYDIAYNFTQNNITLEHNAMNNKNTIAHTDAHKHAVLSTLRAARLMRTVHIAPCGSSPPCMRHPIHACALVCCVLVVFSSTVSILYFVPPFSFKPFLMFTSEFNERSRSNPLCDFRLGTVVTSDHETPLTGYEPKKDLNLVNTEELDLAATSDVYWLHTLDDDASLNDPNVDDNQLAKYLAVVVDSTGKPVEMRSNNDQFSCDTRNLKSAQNQFPVVAQPELICQTGGSVQARIAEERDSSNAQSRTMLSEQRRKIIAECNEKVLHHELLRTPRSSCRTRSQSFSRRITATATGFS